MAKRQGVKVCPRQLRRFAASKLAYAVQSGKLPRVTTLLCVECGEPARRYDHRDYTKPLDVQPVCHCCRSHQGLPDINGPCVEIDWLRSTQKIEKCDKCGCPSFGKVGYEISQAKAKRVEVWE